GGCRPKADPWLRFSVEAVVSAAIHQFCRRHAHSTSLRAGSAATALRYSCHPCHPGLSALSQLVLIRVIRVSQKEKAPGGFTPPGAVFCIRWELSLALLNCDHKRDAAVLQ